MLSRLTDAGCYVGVFSDRRGKGRLQVGRAACHHSFRVAKIRGIAFVVRTLVRFPAIYRRLRTRVFGQAHSF